MTDQAYIGLLERNQIDTERRRFVQSGCAPIQQRVISRADSLNKVRGDSANNDIRSVRLVKRCGNDNSRSTLGSIGAGEIGHYYITWFKHDRTHHQTGSPDDLAS